MEFKTQKKKDNKPRGTEPRKKVPKKITETYLHNSGLYYLQRYATSAANFRSVMLRKVRKSCMHHTDQDFEACAAMVDALVEKFIRTALINDDVYIEGVIRSERRRGRSHKAITAKLMGKGMKSEFIQQKLAEHAEAEDGDTELNAAMVFAKRKKFGPYAIKEHDTQKVLASFARAGFSYQVAKHILDVDLDES